LNASSETVLRTWARWRDVEKDDDPKVIENELRAEIEAELTSRGIPFEGSGFYSQINDTHSDFFLSGRKVLVVEARVPMTPLQAVEFELEEIRQMRHQAITPALFLKGSCLLARKMFERDILRAEEAA
jgi:hypothetical protein